MMAGMIGTYHVSADEAAGARSRRRRSRARPAPPPRPRWTPTCPAAGRHAATRTASIQFAAFAPRRIDVLAGDTVRWTNDSVRAHTVTADDGSWSSRAHRRRRQLQPRFDTPAASPYYCGLHPFMRGEVDVHTCCSRPRPSRERPAGRSRFRGRSALPPGKSVRIEADTRRRFQAGRHDHRRERRPFATDVVPAHDGDLSRRRRRRREPAGVLLVLNRKRRVRPRRPQRVRRQLAVAPASPGRPSSCSSACPSTSAGGRSRARSSTPTRRRASR